MLVDLGPQNLDYNKVYNITRTAYPEGYMVDVEIEATSPSTVSSAIQTTLNTANATFPVNFILKNTVTTGAGNTDITIPTQNGAGRSIDVCLTFKKMPSDAAGTLAIKTDRAGESTTTATNKLSVVLPESETGINLNIDAPTSTVSLKSASGGATKFKEVVARTAFNTLVVDDDVTVGNAEIKDGVVQINNEGILESWSFGAKSNGDVVRILYDGGIEPLMIPRTDMYGNTMDVYQIIRENGEPYYVKNCKFVHVNHDLSVIPIGNDLIEFRVPCYPPEESNGITFEGCEFSEGTKFWGYFSRHDPDNQNPISFPSDDNIHFTGYVNFVNCKMGGVDFTGANTDFVKNFSALTGTHFIIKFNGVPKYEVIPQWDSENGRNVIRPIAE